MDIPNSNGITFIENYSGFNFNGINNKWRQIDIFKCLNTGKSLYKLMSMKASNM